MYVSTAYVNQLPKRFSAYQSGNIHLVQDTDAEGGQAYYFVRVSQWQKQRFLRDVAGTEPLNLEDYGEIVYSAYGEEPSDEALEFVRQHYGWQN